MTMTKEQALLAVKLIEEGEGMEARVYKAISLEVLPAFFEQISETMDIQKAAADRLLRERGADLQKLTTAEAAVKKAEADAQGAKENADDTRLPAGTITIYGGKDDPNIEVLVLQGAPPELLASLAESAKQFLAGSTDGAGPPISKAKSLNAGYLGYPIYGSAAVMRIGDDGRLMAKAAPSDSPADQSLTAWVRSGRSGAGPKITMT